MRILFGVLPTGSTLLLENGKAMFNAPESNEEYAQTEAPMGAAQQVLVSFSLPNTIRIVITNVLCLTELCVAMYLAKQNPEEFTPVFLKAFFSLLVPTLIVGIISKRFVPPKRQQLSGP